MKTLQVKAIELHRTQFSKLFNSFSSGIDFRRQILTSNVDPRTEIKYSSAFRVMACVFIETLRT